MKQNKEKTPQRTRISDIRKKELTSAALRCIAIKGFDRVTLDDVAKEAGFSQGIALYYFKNREALLNSSIESIWEDMKNLTRDVWSIPPDVDDEEKIYEYIRKYYSSPDTDFISIIKNGIKILLQWFDDNPHTILVALEFWGQVPRNPMINSLKDTFQPYIRNTSAVVIQEGIKRGVFKKRNPQIAAHTLLSVLTGFALSAVVSKKDEFKINDLENDYIEVILAYLCGS
jgi:AcrR family transcriptional regulator